jgi:hypothetical protein
MCGVLVILVCVLVFTVFFFVLIGLRIFIFICFVCTSARILPPTDNSIAISSSSSSSNNNNNNNNNNSNTGPSHTNKKLQQVYFEAAKQRLAVQNMWKSHYHNV